MALRAANAQNVTLTRDAGEIIRRLAHRPAAQTENWRVEQEKRSNARPADMRIEPVLKTTYCHDDTKDETKSACVSHGNLTHNVETDQCNRYHYDKQCQTVN